jgi:hypothetical protein
MQRSFPLSKDNSWKSADRSGLSSSLASSRGSFKMQKLGGREVKCRPVEVSTLCVSGPASLSISAWKGRPCSHWLEIYEFSLGGGTGFISLQEQVGFSSGKELGKKIQHCYHQFCGTDSPALYHFVICTRMHTSIHTLCAHVFSYKIRQSDRVVCFWISSNPQLQ